MASFVTKSPKPGLYNAKCVLALVQESTKLPNFEGNTAILNLKEYRNNAPKYIITFPIKLCTHVLKFLKSTLCFDVSKRFNFDIIEIVPQRIYLFITLQFQVVCLKAATATNENHA